jgi:hypothetical protein
MKIYPNNLIGICYCHIHEINFYYKIVGTKNNKFIIETIYTTSVGVDKSSKPFKIESKYLRQLFIDKKCYKIDSEFYENLSKASTIR